MEKDSKNNKEIEKLIEVRCPNSILERNGKVYQCRALLCKMTKESAIEIVCRKCRNKMLIVVGRKDGKLKYKVRF